MKLSTCRVTISQQNWSSILNPTKKNEAMNTGQFRQFGLQQQPQRISKREHRHFKVKTMTISWTFHNLWDEHPYKLFKTNDRKRLDSATKVNTFLLFWIFIIKEIISSFAIDEFNVLVKMSFAKSWFVSFLSQKSTVPFSLVLSDDV